MNRSTETSELSEDRGFGDVLAQMVCAEIISSALLCWLPLQRLQTRRQLLTVEDQQGEAGHRNDGDT